MRPIFILTCLSFFSLAITAQQIDLYSTFYFPSKPYGGLKELQKFVKQELVFPDDARAEESNNSVYINFMVNESGNVTYKQVVESGSKSMDIEASRIFDKIMWLADEEREGKTFEMEKLKIEFQYKKYNRLVKKRGYDKLPYGDFSIDNSNLYYSINQVDVKPQIKGNSSMNAYVSQNIKYPPIAYQRSISGRVTVEFIIEPYGLASNVRIIEAVAGGCNEETIRLIKSMSWEPAFKDGKAVRTLFQYQLNFIHPGGTVK